MATFIRSSLIEAVPLILARLRAVSGFPSERCYAGRAGLINSGGASSGAMQKERKRSRRRLEGRWRWR